MDCISNYIPDHDENEDEPIDEREAELQQLRDEAGFARKKAVAITKLLAGSPLDMLAVPRERLLIEWHVMSLFDEATRTERAISEREKHRSQYPPAKSRDALLSEFKTLQQTIMLHHDGIDQVSRRQAMVEAAIWKLDEEVYSERVCQEVAK